MKKLGIRKLASLLLAVSVASSLFLCACDGTVQTTETSETTEVTESVETTPPNGRDTTPYKLTKLDGNKDHHFLTTDYCYIESDKYVLFLEKNLDIPGDFVNNLDQILNELEKQLGLSVAPAGFEEHEVYDLSEVYGTNPWKDWRIGPRMAIFVYFDRDGGWRNDAEIRDYDVSICMNDLVSEEQWNATKELRAEYLKKSGYIHYFEITGALTQAIVARNSQYEQPEMTMKGIAEYMSRSVLDALASGSPSINMALQNRSPYLYQIRDAINAENAEIYYLNGFWVKGKSIPTNAEEAYGRYFFKFLKEEYGDNFFQMYVRKTNAYGVLGNFSTIMKATYGDDVFTRFGDWCVENQVLQYVTEEEQ